MRRLLSITLTCLIFVSCVPVLSRNMLIQGTFSRNLSEITRDKAASTDRIFILGGVIVKTTPTREGSLIEAIFVPVNSRGYLKGVSASSGRFLALQQDGKLLDPLIYSEKREITLAGEFIGMRKGKIGEMDYEYPLFAIKEIYLWEEVKEKDYYYYYMPPPYPYWYYRHRMYDPWWWY